jgi:hypothetical protein
MFVSLNLGVSKDNYFLKRKIISMGAWLRSAQ